MEERLFGGNVADLVVRVGDTVRKPATSATSSVEAFLEHLFHVGFEGAPRTLGRDEQGRHVLEYIPGETVARPELLSEAELARVGRLIRRFHDAARSFVPPVGAEWGTLIRPDREEMICHHDLSPWNLVRNEERWVFVDWDASGPGSAMWDVAAAAQSFVPLNGSGEPRQDAVRLQAFVGGYGMDKSQREMLPEKMAERTWAGVKLLEDGARMGVQPWARLYAEDHGAYWRRAAEYVERHSGVWRDELLL
jgi:Ser/Thr protein kinase RdoA (MazF antagonist)